jgi:glycosyltransferase involved in cell wall biosynthesis
MACRLPVVATRASQAAQEMIRSGKNGYVVTEANTFSDLLQEYIRRKNLIFLHIKMVKIDP